MNLILDFDLSEDDWNNITPTLRMYSFLSGVDDVKRSDFCNFLSTLNKKELVTLFYEVSDSKSRRVLGFSSKDVEFFRSEIKVCLENKFRPIFKQKRKIPDCRNVYVIITSFLMPNITNSHVKMLSNFTSSILKEHPDNRVELIVSMERSGHGLWSRNWSFRNDSVLIDYWGSEFGDRSKIHINSDNSIDPVSWVLKKINRINPVNVIFHGGPTECSLSGFFIKDKWKSTYLPSNVNDKPTMLVDTVLVRTPYMMTKMKDFYRDCTITPNLVFFDLPIRAFEKKDLIKRLISNHSNKVILGIVIGRNLVVDFLEAMSLSDFIEFLNLVCSHKSSFVVIGDNDFSCLSKDKLNVINDFKNLGNFICKGNISEAELAKELTTIDVLFTLPTVSGGAGALSIGAQLGCGLIVGDDNDGRINTTNDFSFDGFDDLLLLLRRVLEDNEFRDRCKKIAAKVVDERIVGKNNICNLL